jgi:hypothetical protein
VTTGLPHLRLQAAAAFALSLLATLLALPALAQGRKAACTSHGHTSHAHVHVCAAHSHTGRLHRDRRHHGGHGAVKPLAAARLAPTGAICDASAALAVGRGAPSCVAASEAACAEGSSPPPAGGEAAPACPASGERDTGAGETTCEDAAGAACDPAEEDAGSPCEETSPAAPSGEGPDFICEG